MERTGVNRERRKKLNKLRRPHQTPLTLSPPDAQVEEQRKSEEPEDPQESGKNGSKPVKGEKYYVVSTMPVRKNTSEMMRAAGNPNDYELDPARENVTIRGADTESKDDFTASQVDTGSIEL